LLYQVNIDEFFLNYWNTFTSFAEGTSCISKRVLVCSSITTRDYLQSFAESSRMSVALKKM